MLVAAILMSTANASIVSRPPAQGANSHYASNRAPLNQTPLIKLPITAFKPLGWLRKTLELQRDGLTGHLSEISIWLTKKDNAWLSPKGEGKYGWEEVPYWLRGFSRIAYVLDDPRMLKETKIWIEGTLASARPDGDFGPIHYHAPGVRDLWAQMLMLQTLQAWYERTGDRRVIGLMTRYFKWELAIPDEKFLKDYWENSRGGDNLASVYWLYNRTGEPWLLDLATKIDRNTANWRQKDALPNLHNVNVAQSFREPAIYWQQSGKQSDLQASYADFDTIRTHFGQVPGGMFGADENARPGYDDPRQATETCGFVEQLGSNAEMAALTADPKWVANSEDVAFNSLPAAFTPDYRALRYLTAPNMAVSDAANHSPGIENGGPFLLMNPFSSRCCQHNSSSAWVNYLEGTWMATQDDGIAGLSYSSGSVTAKVGEGAAASVKVDSHYPFASDVHLTLNLSSPSEFPLYLLIPAWAEGATVKWPGGTAPTEPGKYVRLVRTWKTGDKVALELPMKPKLKTWAAMKGSGSVEYGPLTFSLEIAERYHEVEGLKTAIGDSGWQPDVDQSQWKTYEILPESAWNYGLTEGAQFRVVRRAWPADDFPFTAGAVPLTISTTGRQIPAWNLDQYGLVSVLPQSPLKVDKPVTNLTLIPMGAARLRISAFPIVQEP